MTSIQRFWLIFSITVLFLLYLLHSIITPFLIAAFLAYLGDPLVERLTRFKISRTWAATIVFVIIMSVVLALLLFLIPLLIRQISIFITRLPEILIWVQQNVLPWLNKEFGITLSLDVQDLKTIITQHWQQAGNIAANVWSIFSRSGVALLSWLAQLLIIPVVMFYLLRDWDVVVKNIRQLLPRKYEPQIMQVALECDSVLGAFLRGQLLVMLGLAVVYSVGLAIAGLDLALLIGSIIGLLAIVPYLGVILGIFIAGIATFIQYHDWIHLLYVAIVFVVGHVAEHFVLTPWLVGDRIGLHPVAVIFAVLAGGHLFGFMGVLLGLPVAAIIMVLLRHVKGHYIKSRLYT